MVGFQGIFLDNWIFMFGWGGLDISVVVVVVVIKVDCCDIYMDVDGVYIMDLCIVFKVQWFDWVFFEEMFEMVLLGVKVLQVCLVEMVMVYGVCIFVCFSFDDLDVFQIDQNGLFIGIFICDEDEFVEQQVVIGIVYVKDEV